MRVSLGKGKKSGKKTIAPKKNFSSSTHPKDIAEDYDRIF